MVEYNTANAKLSDSQLPNAINAKMFNGNNLPRKLLLTTRQTTKPRNAIEDNMQLI